ncbi:hypothetical protein C8J57DRAFT_1706640 [Mycena rebaudengoi]|nr:hypothetical protein C8J57DRAFT_1706640 [Mycena rebaudengoi]
MSTMKTPAHPATSETPETKPSKVSLLKSRVQHLEEELVELKKQNKVNIELRLGDATPIQELSESVEIKSESVAEGTGSIQDLESENAKLKDDIAKSKADLVKLKDKLKNRNVKLKNQNTALADEVAKLKNSSSLDGDSFHDKTCGVTPTERTLFDEPPAKKQKIDIPRSRKKLKVPQPTPSVPRLKPGQSDDTGLIILNYDEDMGERWERC